MNIAILSNLEIFPLSGGAPNRIFNIARTLADMGQNVYLVSRSKSAGVTKLGNLNLVGFQFSDRRLIRTVAQNTRLARAIRKIDVRLDILQCEFPYVFPGAYLAKHFRGRPPLVLDEHGVETNFVREVYFTKPGTVLRSYVFFSELAATRLSSHIFTCSKVDSEQISRIYKVPTSKITDIPNAVNKEFLLDVAPHKFERPTVLFLGGFRHPPNLYAAKAIQDAIAPRVIDRERNAQFVFVGQEPPPWLSNTDSVRVLGYVPDVRPLIKGANVCISPIFQGSGTRLKILEYMALGKPVVSTMKGAEGIEITNGRDIIIEDDMERFSDRIVDLIRDTAEADQLGLNARKIVEKKYTWEKVCESAMTVYQELCSRSH